MKNYHVIAAAIGKESKFKNHQGRMVSYTLGVDMSDSEIIDLVSQGLSIDGHFGNNGGVSDAVNLQQFATRGAQAHSSSFKKVNVTFKKVATKKNSKVNLLERKLELAKAYGGDLNKAEELLAKSESELTKADIKLVSSTLGEAKNKTEAHVLLHA